MSIEHNGQPALKDIFKNDFDVGVALNLDQISGREPSSIALVEKHFNSISPENILKWEEVHPAPGNYNFKNVDRYIDFGTKHGMQIIGHTLVWFNQTPGWVFQDASGNDVNREALLGRMKDHIFAVVGRYKGRIHGWDVVNEAIAPDGQFRRCKWLDIIGEDYILKAFEYAHQADPNAELYYNDYDTENKSKCEGVVRLVQNLKSRNIRIDGIGLQGHWFLDYPSIGEIEASFSAFSKFDLKLMITELDVSVLPFYPVDSTVIDISNFDAELQKRYNPYPDGLPESVQKKLANRYAELFLLFHTHRDKMSRVTFWAVHDGQSWRSYVPIRGIVDYPMLFDRFCKPKSAFDAVVKAIQEN